LNQALEAGSVGSDAIINNQNSAIN